eukprot:5913101-Karenia_brevis.AAC.1
MLSVVVAALCGTAQPAVAGMRQTTIHDSLDRTDRSSSSNSPGCCGAVSYTHLTLPTICSV